MMENSGDMRRISSEKEHLMYEILDNLTDSFYIVDKNWRLTYLNRVTESVWNCVKEEYLGKSIWELFLPSESADDNMNRIAANNRRLQELAMSTRTATHWETSSPDYKNWAEISAYPTQDGGLAIFFRDITEKKRAEEVLRVSKERQAIMLTLSDSLRFLENPGDIKEAAAHIMGVYLGVDMAFFCDVVTVDGVEYFSLDNIYTVSDTHVPLGLHPIDSPGVLADENHAGRNIVVHDMESDPRITDADRPALRMRRLSAWVSVPLVRYGKLVASFTVHQATARKWTQDEISLIEETTARTWAEVERVRAEIALRDSEKRALSLVSKLKMEDRNKNAFINALSHELRNPLAAIVASLSMLDVLDRNTETKKPKDIIKRQTEQLCHLVDDLLDMTRINNNKIILSPESTDLNELARAAVVDHKKLFSDKGIKFEADICPERLFINADHIRILQVIDNLLNNAYKFTNKGGWTVLSTARQGDQAVITIRDNGIGIEASLLPELFGSFIQAEHHKGGLGLGLSIVKGIVELHGGSVAAESEGPDQGATFTVSLPLSIPLPTNSVSVTRAEPASSQLLKILLIDDNRDLVEMTEAYLSLLGYETASSYSGADGIDKAKEFLPHVIICDIGLPDVDGYEVARRISANKDLAATCLISLSGYAQASDLELSRAAGYDMQLSKPVDFSNLKSILDSITQKQRSR